MSAGYVGHQASGRPAVAALCFGLVAAAMVMSLWLSFAAAIPGVAAFSLGRLAWKEQRPYAFTAMVLGAVGMLVTAVALSSFLVAG